MMSTEITRKVLAELLCDGTEPIPEVPKKSKAAEVATTNVVSDEPTVELTLEEKVVKKIQGIFDPELPVNIYDLGLIYKIDISPENRVHIDMTLTAPGCPVAGTLPPMVERMVATVEGVKEAKVELVWQPAWDKSRMSEAAMLELGFF